MLFFCYCEPPQKDSASKAAEAEWKEKAKKELEDWHVHQNEQMEKNKANNRLVSDPSAFNKRRNNHSCFIIDVSCNTVVTLCINKGSYYTAVSLEGCQLKKLVLDVLGFCQLIEQSILSTHL